jgi:pimeloyl-ACP methyl ester carboxylesterase
MRLTKFMGYIPMSRISCLLTLLLLALTGHSAAFSTPHTASLMSAPNSKTIVFLHGLFQNPLSWAHWIQHFEAKGYTCHAPAYPFHAGDPAALRANPPAGLRKLRFDEVLDSLAAFIKTLPEKPILIGHSMGGLAVQSLLQRDLAVAGVSIDPAPPKGVFTFKWSFLRANIATINPLKGNSPCLPSVKWFHYAFCNTMTMAETQAEYDRFVVPEGRNVPRSSTGKAGKIDFKRPHVPLLIIAGGSDNIIPPSLNEKNYKAYKNSEGRTDFKVFDGRGHYICGQKGWEEVADYAADWLKGL